MLPPNIELGDDVCPKPADWPKIDADEPKVVVLLCPKGDDVATGAAVAADTAKGDAADAVDVAPPPKIEELCPNGLAVAACDVGVPKMVVESGFGDVLPPPKPPPPPPDPKIEAAGLLADPKLADVPKIFAFPL